MVRILTGVQSTGTPHLGNLLGAVFPAIELSKDEKNECFFFIADLHSLTQIKNIPNFPASSPIIVSSIPYLMLRNGDIIKIE